MHRYLDARLLKAMGEQLTAEQERQEAEIHRLAGSSFNINSPKQLGEILFGHMKLVDKPKKTKTGQFKNPK